MTMTTYYRKSRERFESFAGLDAPHLPMYGVDATQVQLHRWQVRLFGAQPDELMALGVAEEVGELDESKCHDDEFDAVGDALIFATQLFTSNRLAVSAAIEAAELLAGSDQPPLGLAAASGRLCRAVLKRAQRVRGHDDEEVARRALFEAAVGLFAAARRFGGFGLASTLIVVAGDVMERSAGHAAVPATARAD